MGVDPREGCKYTENVVRLWIEESKYRRISKVN